MAGKDSQLLLRIALCEQECPGCAAHRLWLTGLDASGSKWGQFCGAIYTPQDDIRLRWHPCLAVSSILSYFLHILSSESVSLISHEQCRATGDVGLIPGLGRSPGGGANGTPFQWSCLRNPMDRGTWLATGCPGGRNWALACARRTLRNEVREILKS